MIIIIILTTVVTELILNISNPCHSTGSYTAS